MKHRISWTVAFISFYVACAAIIYALTPEQLKGNDNGVVWMVSVWGFALLPFAVEQIVNPVYHALEAHKVFIPDWIMLVVIIAPTTIGMMWVALSLPNVALWDVLAKWIISFFVCSLQAAIFPLAINDLIDLWQPVGVLAATPIDDHFWDLGA